MFADSASLPLGMAATVIGIISKWAPEKTAIYDLEQVFGILADL